MQDFAKQMRDLGRRQANAMRDKARETALKRKEEYLGARVPRELREKVIAKAEALGVPVSILIRHILEQAFSDGKEADPGKARIPEEGRGESFPGVIGWEQIVLNRTMQCASCARHIRPGTAVTLGLAAPGEDHVILCAKCREPV